MYQPMQGIAELPSYARLAAKLLDQQERQDLIAYLANHPDAGDLMEGTGGVRKLRWSRGSQGKSGGVRVIYYFHDAQMPLYLLTLCATLLVWRTRIHLLWLIGAGAVLGALGLL